MNTTRRVASYLVSIALLVQLAPPALAQRIIQATGSVTVKRGDRTRSVGVGFELRPGDIVQSGSNATVTVACPDASIWSVAAELPTELSRGCPAEATPRGLSADRKIIQYLPGGSNPAVPYVISPRNTTLLTTTPTIQWNPVTGSTLYRVRINGGNVVWETEVTATQVTYPPNAPSLEPGVPYRVAIETNTGVSSLDDGDAQVSFDVLHPADAERIEATLAAIQRANMTPDREAIAKAEFYTEFGLVAPAIAVLEPLVRQNSQNPLVYRVLGNLYARARLNQLAATTLTRAIELAKTSQDTRVLAEAEASLAAVRVVLDDSAEGYRLADLAYTKFLDLGDADVADYLYDWLIGIEAEAIGGNDPSFAGVRRGTPTPPLCVSPFC